MPAHLGSVMNDCTIVGAAHEHLARRIPAIRVPPRPGISRRGPPIAIKIRLLTPADQGVLTNIAPGVFDDPLDAARTREFLGDERHHLAVAVDDGVVVGFASALYYVHPDKARPELWINEVGVAPTHHGRGIGKAILRALLAAGWDAGCSEAWVLTERSNAAAMRLYASVGGAEAPEEAVMFRFFPDLSAFPISSDASNASDAPVFMPFGARYNP